MDDPDDLLEAQMAIDNPTANEQIVLDRVFRFEAIAHERAMKHTIQPRLVLAMICQESSGNPYACRIERGFWSRYGTNAISLFKRTPSKFDDKWGQYPDIAAMSIGLMQVLYTVAIERGMVLQYPLELCDPEKGIEAGCRQLKHCYGLIAQRDSYLFVPQYNTRLALLRYNGGGDRTYPDRILRWQGLVIGERRRRHPH